MSTQDERRQWLIKALLAERGERLEIPADTKSQKQLLRALLNVRPPLPASVEFLRVQDAYLQEETRRKGISNYKNLQPIQPGIYLWQGDITTLQCGAIVDAANSQLLGCFHPNHDCIDNAIHTFAGVQLRLECAEIMKNQGHKEPTGRAKITGAYNLPCDRILHTVGPIANGRVASEDEQNLKDCYISCLEIAKENGIKSVAFCCISTGVFRFPNRLAAEIAVETVRKYKVDMEVIFNVFKDSDYKIYQEYLSGT